MERMVIEESIFFTMITNIKRLIEDGPHVGKAKHSKSPY